MADLNDGPVRCLLRAFHCVLFHALVFDTATKHGWSREPVGGLNICQSRGHEAPFGLHDSIFQDTWHSSSLSLAEKALRGLCQQEVISIPDNFKLVALIFQVLPFSKVLVSGLPAAGPNQSHRREKDQSPQSLKSHSESLSSQEV